ncbi:MAG: hypothetical protein Q9170_003471, partial [Blastenia crenularia]
MSPLETLPTEILSTIFLLCLNPSLPLTSRTLNAKLNSDHLKQQFRFFTTKIKCYVFPSDGFDEAILAHIRTELARITGVEDLYSFIDDGELYYWEVEVNVLQREKVEGIEGVDEVPTREEADSFEDVIRVEITERFE